MSANPEFPARDPGFPRFLWVAALLTLALVVPMIWVLFQQGRERTKPVLPEPGP